MMQTITEIRQEEADRRLRAARYETLLGERSALAVTIQRLTDAAVDPTLLRRIYEIVTDEELKFPKALLTVGTSGLAWSIPSDMVVRDVISQVAGNALDRAERKERERLAELGEAQARLNEVESELREF